MISRIFRNKRERRRSALHTLDGFIVNDKKGITIFHEHLRRVGKRDNVSLSLVALTNDMLRNAITSRNGLTGRNSLINDKSILRRSSSSGRGAVGNSYLVCRNLICRELTSIISNERSVIHEGLELILNHIPLRLANQLSNSGGGHRVLSNLEDRLSDFCVHCFFFLFFTLVGDLYQQTSCSVFLPTFFQDHMNFLERWRLS